MQQFEGYTRREVERAIEARKLQARTGHTSEAEMKAEVSRKPNPSRIFKRAKIAVSKIKNANKIFGPSISCLKGKWVRKKPSCVNLDCVSIPVSLIERN